MICFALLIHRTFPHNLAFYKKKKNITPRISQNYYISSRKFAFARKTFGFSRKTCSFAKLLHSTKTFCILQQNTCILPLKRFIAQKTLRFALSQYIFVFPRETSLANDCVSLRNLAFPHETFAFSRKIMHFNVAFSCKVLRFPDKLCFFPISLFFFLPPPCPFRASVLI